MIKKTRSSPINRTDQKPKTDHCGRILLNGKARGTCACGWTGTGREYRKDALADLLEHYETAGTLREPEHRLMEINDCRYTTWTGTGRTPSHSRSG